MKQKLFTKSAFKVALTCPRSLYYYYNSDRYANQNNDDEFLQSLAEGGFQVGELAKVYYGISGRNDIKSLDYDESQHITQELMQANDVNIAEAAFRYGNCFVRVDILEKKGDCINLIEVKAKSWNENEDSLVTKKDAMKVNKDYREYVYDVAFQKYVVTGALKELYPDRNFKVHAYLMMADKASRASVDGINQCFKITRCGGRTGVERMPQAESLAGATHVLKAIDVNTLCQHIINGDTTEQEELMHSKFIPFVQEMSHKYCNNIRPDACLSGECLKCPFHLVAGQNDGLKDGMLECWQQMAGLCKEDFDKPMVRDLNGGGGFRRGELIAAQKYYLDGMTEEDIKLKDDDTIGLSYSRRRWLQVGMLTHNPAILSDFAPYVQGETYLDVDGLRREMAEWEYPLHMIDFETTAVALPFYSGLHPYEQVAFQFSHHIIDRKADGSYTIRHAGQFINAEKGHFPNFDFVRELKRQLETDGGTVFRYAAHENTILRCIHDQLSESSEPDREQLMAFIDTITEVGEGKKRVYGERNMVDLLEVVRRNYYHTSMKNSNSIKAVLPAVLNSSRLLQEKYSLPIYGSEIHSKNIPATDPIAWITFAQDGKTVENPYKHLPPVGHYLDMDDNEIVESDSDDDMTVANGGAALTAYSKMQFSDTEKSDALIRALLRYCELDTMAMVFIWEYFNDMVSRNQ